MTSNRSLMSLAAPLALLFLCLPFTSAQSNRYAPVINSISGCPVSPQDNSTLLCSPPFTLTVSGSGFTGTDVVNISNYACPAVSVSTDLTTLACYVPNQHMQHPSNNPAIPLSVSIIDLSTSLESNTITSALQLVPPQPVLLTSIGGCTGSGASTNGCNLLVDMITVRGSGFIMDGRGWSMVFGSGIFGVQAGYTTWPILSSYFVGTDSVVFPLNYTLYNRNPILAQYPNGTTSTMSFCFIHGSTASNCLALSLYYIPPSNTTLPPLPPTTTPGLSTNTSLSILTVSGCGSDWSNGSTSGCTVGSAALLTIVGRQFPSVLQMYVTVGGVRCQNPYLAWLNSSQLLCAVSNEYASLVVGTWLPVVIVDLFRLQQSPPAYLVQYGPPVYPTLTSITGCSGDSPTPSLTTTNCNISNTLTISSSANFSSDWSINQQIVVGVLGVSLGPYNRLPFNYYVVGGVVQLPMSLVFSQIQSSITTASTDVLLYMLVGSQILGPLTVTIPTRPLAVTQLTGCGSSSPNFTLAGCNPGVSVISLQGVSFMSVVSVSVGGQPCVVLTSASTFVTCTLPIIYGMQGGLGYDLTLSNFAGNITLPAAITYTTNPTIVSVTSPFCPPDFAWPYPSAPVPLYCSAYAQLTLVGVYFQDLSTLTVNITASNQPPLTCGNLTYQSSDELTCTLPAASRSFALATPHGITAWENSTFPSNTFRANVYTVADYQPNIAYVQGCVSADSATRVVSGCQAGDGITLVGTNFVPFSVNTQVQLWVDNDVFLCGTPLLVSSTVLTCVLPSMPLLTVDTILPIRIANMNKQQSNW